MQRNITIKEAETEEARALFHKMHDDMTRSDLPLSDLDRPFTKGEEESLLSPEYHETMDELCTRRVDPMHMVLFMEGDECVGGAYYGIALSKDGRCFVYSFYVVPQRRGQGIGRTAFEALRSKAESEGAAYFELNAASRRAASFWARRGFYLNGRDNMGQTLMCIPPCETGEVRVEILSDPYECGDYEQLHRLLNSRLREEEKAPVDEVHMDGLCRAIEDWELTVFVAMRRGRMVGMAVISYSYSPANGVRQGCFGDLFVETAFRHRGIAHQLAEGARTWCRRKGMAGLSALCANSREEELAEELGFRNRKGSWLFCSSKED